jgi:GT2 family glycosyltransferase
VITIAVITHNRLYLLRRCVDDVLRRTSEKTREIVIWNNGSTDGTKDYLDALDDPRLRIVHHPQNIGVNAYARAFSLASQPYLVELDDDVIEAPARWDEQLLDAFVRIPKMGYLSAAIADDPRDSQAQYIKYLREERGAYVRREVNGVTILEGPTGGGCTITSRELYDRIGGFRENSKLAFWREDARYVRDVHRLGYRSAVLEGTVVWHAGGVYYSDVSDAKMQFYEWQDHMLRRKDLVKRVLLRIPPIAVLNRRYDWFEPPHTYEPPAFDEMRGDGEPEFVSPLGLPPDPR